MSRPPIHPGRVEWSGENPGMYLRESAEGRYVTLISFFRVVFSPFGRGHAAFCFRDPHGTGKAPGKSNRCVTDNEPLAGYLKAHFLACFPAFRGIAALENFRYDAGSHFVASGDARTSYTERFRTERGDVILTWKPLEDAFMVALPREKSATGRHEMFSLFVNAAGIEGAIEGQPLVGRPFPREFAGKASSTAFLAFSETWVRC